MFRIASVSFLNAVPLIDWLVQSGDPDISVTQDLPSRLLALLQNGTADVALLPVADVLCESIGGILPVGGIACHGAVDSVKLFSVSSLAKLNRIWADRGSRSSVALSRVLLAEMHGISPAITELEPQTGLLPRANEGILIIGDRCFEYEKFLREAGHTEVRAWDLGELWFSLTGLPFVFAIWAVSPDFPARDGGRAVAELKRILADSLRKGLDNLPGLAAREAAAGRLGHEGQASAEAIGYYFQRSLCFTIGDEELAGIRYFHDLAVKHQVIPEGPLPPIL